MKKYIMILIIILGVICCDLAFCQLDKSVLIIHYGDVNYYAENENYWAETNGRNVEFTDKKSENKICHVAFTSFLLEVRQLLHHIIFHANILHNSCCDVAIEIT